MIYINFILEKRFNIDQNTPDIINLIDDHSLTTYSAAQFFQTNFTYYSKI